MLPFPTFEKTIDPTILARGRQYYETQAVAGLAERGANEWRATVLGSVEYTVELTLDGDQVSRWHCDCPYDGPVCKHVVAALFALREKLIPPAGGQPTPPRKSRFDTVLEKLSREELRAFLRMEKDKDPEFGERLLLYFASKDSQTDKATKQRYRRLIKGIVKRYTRRGFMEYRSTFRFAKEMKAILDAAQTALNGGAFASAIAIAGAICEVTMELITHADDSAANISYCLDSGIEVLAFVAKDATATPTHLDTIYTWLEHNLVDDIWHDYGNFGSALLDVAATIGERTDPERYLRLLDALIAQEQSKVDNYDYLLRDLTKRKVRFLRVAGRGDQADALLEDHLDIVALRQDAVEAALAAEDYARARQLVETGIELAREKEHPGTVAQWEKTLAHIAERSGDVELFRSIALALALDRGKVDLEYYRAWKNSFPADERAAAVDQLIQSRIDRETAKPDHSRYPLAYRLFRLLSPIYIEEQRWADLARSLPEKMSEGDLQAVHPYLADTYPEVLLPQYLRTVENVAEQVRNRDGYRYLIGLMKTAATLPGARPALVDLAEALIKRYARRRVMVELLKSFKLL